MRLWPTHVLNDSSEFHLASQETASVVHRVPSSIPPTESAAPVELCNMGFVLPQCYETSVKHLRTERIRHASYKSCSALTWCNMGCVKCCSTPFIILYIFSQQTRTKNARSKKVLSNLNINTFCICVSLHFISRFKEVQKIVSTRCSCPTLSRLKGLDKTVTSFSFIIPTHPPREAHSFWKVGGSQPVGTFPGVVVSPLGDPTVW